MTSWLYLLKRLVKHANAGLHIKPTLFLNHFLLLSLLNKDNTKIELLTSRTISFVGQFLSLNCLIYSRLLIHMYWINQVWTRVQKDCLSIGICVAASIQTNALDHFFSVNYYYVSKYSFTQCSFKLSIESKCRKFSATFSVSLCFHNFDWWIIIHYCVIIIQTHNIWFPVHEKLPFAFKFGKTIPFIVFRTDKIARKDNFMHEKLKLFEYIWNSVIGFDEFNLDDTYTCCKRKLHGNRNYSISDAKIHWIPKTATFFKIT